MDMGQPLPDGIGPDVRLIIDTEAGHVLDLTLIESALRARASGGALVPFLYRDPYDPENPDAPRPLRRAVLAIVDDTEVKLVDGPGCTPVRAYAEEG